MCNLICEKTLAQGFYILLPFSALYCSFFLQTATLIFFCFISIYIKETFSIKKQIVLISMKKPHALFQQHENNRGKALCN